MSPVAIVSPSDKVNKKQVKARQSAKIGLASVKLDFEKGSVASGNVEFKEPVSFKIFSESKESKSYDIQDTIASDVQSVWPHLLQALLCEF